MEDDLKNEDDLNQKQKTLTTLNNTKKNEDDLIKSFEDKIKKIKMKTTLKNKI